MARKILIVEDDVIMLQSLARLLTGMGFEVTTAANAAQGLAALDGQDIAIVDLNLPDASGALIVRKVRRESRPIRTAIYTADPNAATLIPPKQQPDAVFDKMDLDGLLNWIGKP